MKLKILTLNEVQEIAHNLAMQTLGWDEPIVELTVKGDTLG